MGVLVIQTQAKCSGRAEASTKGWTHLPTCRLGPPTPVGVETRIHSIPTEAAGPATSPR